MAGFQVLVSLEQGCKGVLLNHAFKRFPVFLFIVGCTFFRSWFGVIAMFMLEVNAAAAVEFYRRDLHHESATLPTCVRHGTHEMLQLDIHWVYRLRRCFSQPERDEMMKKRWPSQGMIQQYRFWRNPLHRCRYLSVGWSWEGRVPPNYSPRHLGF